MPSRIPIPIVILCCVITLSIVWCVGTRDKDFLSEPTPEELIAVTKEWMQNRPNAYPVNNVESALKVNNSPPISPKPMVQAEQEITQLPTGNFLHSPALSEYGTLDDVDTDAMIRLASLLENQGQVQRALLAWERVIDTSKSTANDRSLAVSAIKRLKPTLPPWNPDPEAEMAITLCVGATPKNDEVLIKAIKTAADTITKASGFILNVKTKVSIGRARTPRTPRIPVAIWFSSEINGKNNPTGTPPISFMADPQQEKMLVAQIEAGIYALVRAHLAANTSFSPLPEYPAGAKPDELVKLHITRLMWREFAASMKKQP